MTNPILGRLNQARRLVKGRDAATVALTIATFAGVFLAAEVTLDRLFLLDRSFRSAALAAFAVLGTTLALVGLVLAFRRISLLYAARVLERHAPSLRQSLTTYVQMKLGDATGSGEALKLIETKLARDLAAVDLGAFIRRRLGRLLLVSLAVVTLAGGVSAVVTGSGFPVCVERVLRPGASIAPPTETRIVDVRPGDLHLLQSTDLEVTARIAEVAPAGARVYLAREEGEWYTLALRADPDAWRATIPGGQESYRYFIAAGDTRSDVYRITVLPPPMMTNLSALVSLPSYAGSASKRVAGGDVEVLPRSSVTLTGTPNRTFASAEVVFDDGARFPFKPGAGGKAQVTFSPVASGSYRLELVDDHGLRHPRPPRFRVEVREDRPPDVDIVQPGPIAEVVPDRAVEILVDVSDDYGIELLELVTRLRGKEPRRHLLAFDPARGARQKFTLSPSEFKLAPPDSMLFYVEARDNSPAENRSRSAVHVLHMRRRPLEALEAFEDLRKALEAVASDPVLSRKLELEPGAATPPSESRREDRDLADRQAALARELRQLGKPELAELSRLREDLQKLERDLAALRDATRDLPSRGIEKQRELAPRLAAKSRKLERRAMAARERLDRLSKEDPRRPDQAAQLRAAAAQAEMAAQSLQAAARALRDQREEAAPEFQEQARKAIESAQLAVDEALETNLPESAREKAAELAKAQKLLRELTEELARKSDPDQRRRRAAQAMKDAERAMEQGKPGAAQDAAEEAKELLDSPAPEESGEEPVREPSEERVKSLLEFLGEARAEQERIRRITAEVDDARKGGVLKNADATRLRDAGRAERELASSVREARLLLEREFATVFLWVMDSIRDEMNDVGDLLELETRSDSDVRAREADIERRIGDLIEALRSPPKSGGGGGGGGGRPPNVNLEAQLKLIRILQEGLAAKTKAIRDRMIARREPDPDDLDRLLALVDKQEELKLQLERLVKGLKK